MKSIIEYIVLSEYSTMGISAKVTEYLNDGYIPNGGIVVTFINEEGNQSIQYTQALIKYHNPS